MSIIEDALKMDVNWIYRYRSYSPLSLKELMYNELFFSYSDELNDPLDLKANLYLKKKDKYILEYFILAALKSLNFQKNTEPHKSYAKTVSNCILTSDLSIDDLVDDIHLDIIRNLYYKLINDNDCTRFINHLVNILNNIKPYNLKSISFSSNATNPLLWSIYANKHKGFCLVFNPADKMIRLKRSGESNYRDYKCNTLNYSSDININLSLMFNKNKEIDSVLLNEKYFQELNKKALLTKSPEWLKEKEIRIFGDSSITFSHLSNNTERETSFERTVYYDPKQLAGIILGIGLSESEKSEIRKIYESKSGRLRIFQACSVGNKISIGKVHFINKLF